MSLAEYASRPFPVFAKLAVMLRNIPVMQFVIARVSSLLGNGKASSEPLIVPFVGETPEVTESTDQPVAVLPPSGGLDLAAPKPNDRSEREKLIRRRWAETGIKMWNDATLRIQGSAALLPVKPGETLPAYDTLEFKLIDGRIVCEGCVVDPPKRRK